jgi:hypothetical protein
MRNQPVHRERERKHEEEIQDKLIETAQGAKFRLEELGGSPHSLTVDGSTLLLPIIELPAKR